MACQDTTSVEVQFQFQNKDLSKTIYLNATIELEQILTK